MPLALRADDPRHAARDAGVFVYSRLAGTLLQIGAFIVATRICSRAELAYLAYALMVYQSAVTLGSLGLSESVTFFMGRRTGDEAAVVRQTTLLLALLAPLVLTAVAAVIFAGSAIDLRPAALWIILAVGLELPTQPAIDALLASGRAGAASSVVLGFAVLHVSVLLVPLLAGLGPDGSLRALAGAGAVRIVVYSAVVARFFPAEAARWLDWRRLREILVYSTPAGLALISGTLSAQLDKYVVAFLLTADDVADYAVGAWELPIVTLVPYAVGAVLQPRYVRLHADGRRAELRALWLGTVRKTALVVLPLAALLVALADEIIPMVFSSRYPRAVLIFRIFSTVLVVRVAYYGALLRALGDTRSLLVAALFAIAVNGALAIPFTHLLGFTGAALATLIASLLGMVFIIQRIARGLEVGFAEAFPWRAYAATLGLAAALALPTRLALDALGGPAALRLGLALPAFLLAFYGLGRASGLVRAEDGDFLRRWLTLGLLRERRHR